MIHIAHAFTKAMAHEPSRLIGDAKHPVELMGADTLFARHHEVHSKKPLIQRDFAALHCRPNGHTERLAAFVALIDASAKTFANHFRNARGARIAAMSAIWTIWPTQAFEMLAGFIGIGKDWVCKITHVLCPSNEENISSRFVLRQLDNYLLLCVNRE
jgi:hypothetical protein